MVQVDVLRSAIVECEAQVESYGVGDDDFQSGAEACVERLRKLLAGMDI